MAYRDPDCLAGLQEPAPQRLVLAEIEKDARDAGIVAEPFVAVAVRGTYYRARSE
jgi:hypothetical protein